jgi:hypothetical protein
MVHAKNHILIFVFALSISALACVRITPRPELVFTPDTVPDAQVGVPYEVEIQISQNETPTGDFYISEGNLPKGLTLTYVSYEDKLKISGAPEETGTFIFKTSVWCYGTSVSGQTGEKEYTLVVK